MMEAAWYSGKFNEMEVRRPEFSPSPVHIGEISWIWDSDMSLDLQGAGVVIYLLCDFGQGTYFHWSSVLSQENTSIM